MSHKFSPAKAAYLTSFFRRWLMNPDRVLDDAGIGPGEAWADVGCGNGFHTISMARRASRVFAVDISPEMLTLLEQRLRTETIANVQTVQSEENVIPLAPASLDGVFMAFVAHELTEPEAFFPATVQLLKPGGRLIVIEFSKQALFGPPAHERLEEAQMDILATLSGLSKGRAWRWNRQVIGWEYIR